jgi:glucosamine 6-phosphate synthetase-like amidotransferase/phosphosugar isomerase protein
MTVDSEAILALAAHSRADAHAFEELRGAMATAWFDERAPDVLYLARGAHRPLWIGRTRQELVFASTKHALEVVERYVGIRLRKQEVREGTFAVVRDGDIVIADDDGIVIWPREDIEGLVAKADARRRSDAERLAKIRAR